MAQAESTVFHEDGKVRVTRWTLTSAGDTTGEHEHEYRYVVVPVTGGTLLVAGADGTLTRMQQDGGQPYVGAAGTHHTVTNESGQPIVFVEIEVKDWPV